MLRSGLFLSTRSLLAMGAWNSSSPRQQPDAAAGPPALPACTAHAWLPAAPMLGRQRGSPLLPPALLAPPHLPPTADWLPLRPRAAGMLMWATRLIAGFGAVGLAGEAC